MEKAGIESLVQAYEGGRIGRRELITALTLLAAGSAATTQSAPFQAASLNHVSLAVSDPEASREFYQELLGVSVVSRQENGINLGLGDSFLGLYAIPNPGRIHHFCVGVEGYQIDQAAEKLRQADIEPRIRQDRPELYFTDPDGTVVQLSEKDYRG